MKPMIDTMIANENEFWTPVTLPFNETAPIAYKYQSEISYNFTLIIIRIFWLLITSIA